MICPSKAQRAICQVNDTTNLQQKYMSKINKFSSKIIVKDDNLNTEIVSNIRSSKRVNNKRLVDVNRITKYARVPALPGVRFSTRLNDKDKKRAPGLGKKKEVLCTKEFIHKLQRKCFKYNNHGLVQSEFCYNDELVVDRNSDNGAPSTRGPKLVEVAFSRASARVKKLVISNGWSTIIRGICISRGNLYKSRFTLNTFSILYYSDSDSEQDDQLNGSHGEYTESDDVTLICNRCLEFKRLNCTPKTFRKYESNGRETGCSHCPKEIIREQICIRCYNNLDSVAKDSTKNKYSSDGSLQSCRLCPPSKSKSEVCIACYEQFISTDEKVKDRGAYTIIRQPCVMCPSRKENNVKRHRREVCLRCWPIMFENPNGWASDKTLRKYKKIFGPCEHCINHENTTHLLRPSPVINLPKFDGDTQELTIMMSNSTIDDDAIFVYNGLRISDESVELLKSILLEDAKISNDGGTSACTTLNGANGEVTNSDDVEEGEGIELEERVLEALREGDPLPKEKGKKKKQREAPRQPTQEEKLQYANSFSNTVLACKECSDPFVYTVEWKIYNAVNKFGEPWKCRKCSKKTAARSKMLLKMTKEEHEALLLKEEAERQEIEDQRFVRIQNLDGEHELITMKECRIRLRAKKAADEALPLTMDEYVPPEKESKMKIEAIKTSGFTVESKVEELMYLNNRVGVVAKKFLDDDKKALAEKKKREEEILNISTAVTKLEEMVKHEEEKKSIVSVNRFSPLAEDESDDKQEMKFNTSNDDDITIKNPNHDSESESQDDDDESYIAYCREVDEAIQRYLNDFLFEVSQAVGKCNELDRITLENLITLVLVHKDRLMFFQDLMEKEWGIYHAFEHLLQYQHDDINDILNKLKISKYVGATDYGRIISIDNMKSVVHVAKCQWDSQLYDHKEKHTPNENFDTVSEPSGTVADCEGLQMKGLTPKVTLSPSSVSVSGFDCAVGACGGTELKFMKPVVKKVVTKAINNLDTGFVSNANSTLNPIHNQCQVESREVSEVSEEDSKCISEDTDSLNSDMYPGVEPNYGFADCTNDIHKGANIVVVKHNYIVKGGCYYKFHKLDNKKGVFLKYRDNNYGPEVLEKTYLVYQEGCVLEGYLEHKGVYYKPTREELEQRLIDFPVVMTVSPLQVVPNFIVEARSHRWFRKLRELGPDLLNTITFDAVYKKDEIYARLTKKREDIIIDKSVLSFLQSKYSAQAYTPQGCILLRNSCETYFPLVPREILAGTILYYFQVRAIDRRNDSLTVDALARFISEGRRTHVNPINNLEFNPVNGFDGLTIPGVYTFTTVDECMIKHNTGYTCIQRIQHAPSSNVHGSSNNKVYPSNERFLLDERRSKHVGMNDAYLYVEPGYKRYYDPRNHYNTFGGGFGTGCAEVAVMNDDEICQAMLRLTTDREGGMYLRQKQALLARALLGKLDADGSLRAHLNSEICKYNKKHNRELGIEYPTYVGNYEDRVVMSPNGKPEIYRIVHKTPEHEPQNELFVEVVASICELKKEYINHWETILEAENNYEKANSEYFHMIGTKIPERMRMLRSYIDNKPADIGSKRHMLSQENEIKAKKDEFQKIKKGHLKFGRATVNISGMDLMEANPYKMYALKKILDLPIKVETAVECGVRGLRISIDDEYQRFIPTEEQVRSLYIRSVIKGTDNESLALVVNDAREFIKTHDDSVAFINHGDDMLIMERNEGTLDQPDGIRYIEGDIEKNDSSYTHELLSAMYAYTTSAVCDVTTSFAQLAKNVKIHFDNGVKAVLTNTQGMMLCSGSSMTTYLNSNGSSLIGLAYAFRRSVNTTLAGAAKDVGFLVTSVVGVLEQMTFLSRGFYISSNNIIKSYKCIASITRSFGHVHGDVLGSSKIPVHERWQNHINGVVKAEVHEPDSTFMLAFRCFDRTNMGKLSSIKDLFKIKYRLGKYKNNLEKFVASLGTVREEESINNIHSWMTDLDYGIIVRYYGTQATDFAVGMTDYIAVIEDMINIDLLYGKVILSKFIDSTMFKRYGLQKVCS